MTELLTKADLQAAFDKQALRLTLRLGVMFTIGFGLIFIELAALALCAP